MPSTVKLWFRAREQPFASGERRRVIRLLGHMVFRQRDGKETEAHVAMIDTGATFCLLPRWLWEGLDVTIHDKRVYLTGVHPGKRCQLAALAGTVRLRVVDLGGGSTEEVEVMAYLVKNRRVEVPILLGFADLLERHELVSNYSANRALLRKA